MTHDFPNELVSAYLDREATAAERAVVEDRLAKSADDRQLLADWGRLSTELQSLPNQECPAGFHDRVLRAVEAGMSEPAPAKTADESRRGLLLRNGAALAVTAAALFLAMLVLNPRSDTPSPTSTRRLAEEQEKPSDASLARKLSRVEVRDKELHKDAIPRDEAGKRGLGSSVAAGRRDPYAGTGFGGGAPSVPLVPSVALKGKKAGGGHAAHGLVFIDNLRKLSGDDVGRVLTAIKHSPEGITVVKLTVVDCRKGLDALQVLLSDNRIHGPSAAKSDAAAESKQDDANSRASQRLVAVYVQSSPDRLASVMSELKSKRQFRRLQVDPPIAPTRFDMQTQQQIAMLDQRQYFARPTRADKSSGRRFAIRSAPQPAKKNLAAAGTAGGTKSSRGGQNAATTAKASNGKFAGIAAADKSRIAELDRISRQLHLTIPAELLDRTAVVAQRSKVRGKQSPITAAGIGGPRDLKQQYGTSPATVRPMRVLFVLVCPPDAPGGKSPTAPARRKAGS